MKWTTDWFLKADGYFHEHHKALKKQSQVYGNHDPVGDVSEEVLKKIYGPLMKRVPEVQEASDDLKQEENSEIDQKLKDNAAN